jgi:hypothetical protein
MVGHDYCSVQIVLNRIVVADTGENNGSSPFGQHPAILGDERDEVWLGVALQMRQVAPIEGHNLHCRLFLSATTQENRVGADALVRPVERSSTWFDRPMLWKIQAELGSAARTGASGPT